MFSAALPFAYGLAYKVVAIAQDSIDLADRIFNSLMIKAAPAMEYILIAKRSGCI